MVTLVQLELLLCLLMRTKNLKFSNSVKRPFKKFLDYRRIFGYFDCRVGLEILVKTLVKVETFRLAKLGHHFKIILKTSFFKYFLRFSSK